MSTISKKLLTVLVAVVAGTKSDAGFAFVPKKEGDALTKDGYTELNPNVPGTPAGQVAARATQKGLDAVPAEGSTAAPAAAPKLAFELESGIEVPEVVGRGRVGAGKYPFDSMEVGHSFFIPNVEAKKLGSTVSSANARYAQEIEGQTRVNRKGKTVPATKQTRTYIVRSAEKGGVSGARIFRTA
jgi:hypothetical protein